jgi:hypothetical protein
MFDRKNILDRLAARTCLSRCRYSAAPFTALSDFLDELRERGWDESALARMEAMVRDSLHGRDNMSPCNPDKTP